LMVRTFACPKDFRRSPFGPLCELFTLVSSIVPQTLATVLSVFWVMHHIVNPFLSALPFLYLRFFSLSAFPFFFAPFRKVRSPIPFSFPLSRAPLFLPTGISIACFRFPCFFLRRPPVHHSKSFRGFFSPERFARLFWMFFY